MKGQYGREREDARLDLLQEDLGWYEGGTLTAASIRFDGERWIATVKADFNNTPKYASVTGRSLWEAAATLAEYTRAGWLNWERDSYPPKFRRRKRSALVSRSYERGGKKFDEN
jgi:hypothetical protein